MQLFYEILPVFLFFLAFKFYDIYVATVVGIAATMIQVIATRAVTGTWDRKQVITMCVFLLFGGMTLYFHDPIFVKWKPTIVFWIFSVAIVITQIFTRKPLMQRMMESALQESAIIPQKVWRLLNMIWALFFVLLGGVNLYVAYYLSNDAWVNFKFYGITSALLVFSVFQALYLSRYLETKDPGI
ncbi:MAG TPA: septation protein A [Gammaproteobacteria bacterium]|jgi:intracellular septation protein|nr:septation protein A [Gammaproteobacteria bacterium]